MKRVRSESKEPGMQSQRRCSCGDLATDGEYCSSCHPRLSDRARLVGLERRRAQEEITRVEHQIENLEDLLRKIRRRTKWYPRE